MPMYTMQFLVYDPYSLVCELGNKRKNTRCKISPSVNESDISTRFHTPE